jgi:1,4-dihydroxy-2-naphthoyl-CoA synthase
MLAIVPWSLCGDARGRIKPPAVRLIEKGTIMQKVLVENNADGTTLITINRPERRNAI